MAGKATDTPMRAALVGQGISRSLTPAMHEAEGRALGLKYSYGLIDTGTDTFRDIPLRRIVEEAQASGLLGLNITHPYKNEVLNYIDELSANARKLGAANTVLFQNGKTIGHNTDYSGFAKAFDQEMGGVKKDTVLLSGAGGAGAAVAFALLDSGTRRLLIHDNYPESAIDLAQRLKSNYPEVFVETVATLDQDFVQGLSGIVNATPMGMSSHPGSAFPLELLKSEFWVADIVYFPLETELLTHARTLGCRTMSGAAMAVWQAVHTFQLFTGHKASPTRLTETFSQLSNKLI